jgi:Tol biopolymer transport system component
MTSKIVIILLTILLISSYGQNLFSQQKEAAAIELTADGYFMNPVWSPDGQKIAFSGENYQGLWIYDLATKETQKISDHISAGYEFSWSSDSKNIISRVSKYQGVRRLNAIFMFGLKSSETRRIIDFKNGRLGIPQWSNDESQIYFKEGPVIKYADSKREVQKSKQQFEYTVQNSKIIVRKNNGQKLNILEKQNKFEIIHLRLSPDSKRFVFEAMDGNIYIVDADGSNLIDLGKGDCPEWSPDNNYIIYSISEDDGHEYTSADIYIASADGQYTQNITGTNSLLEMNPSWSPDGKTIVYNDYSNGIIYMLQIVKLK